MAARFAGELNDVLERGRVEHRYERLILVAPPRFLGALHNALGKQVSSCVVAQLDKDIVTLPATEITSSGEVPHDTIGGSDAASRRTVASKCAPASDCSVFQKARAVSHCPPFGAAGLPCT